MSYDASPGSIATRPPQTDVPQVLVVGAGPVGMVLACELLQQDVPVRLIDRIENLNHDDPHSRAILLLPRTLELLRRIGVSERLVQAGQPVPGIQYHAQGRQLGAARMDELPDTPYPFVLALRQRETERVLRERLYELGGTVERGLTLESLDAGGPRPRALLRHADGSTELADADWLVGADGAASITRTLLGTALDGDPTDVTYVIADAPLAGPTSADAQYFYGRDGLVAVVPMGDGNFRIAANVPHRTDATEPDWQALLQEIVDRRARVPLTVGEPSYARMVRPRCGIARTFASGRCFLAGDAAHVITPAGGQGMNLGIQDAVNLGWKLGGVASGRLAESVLDSYESDRRAAVRRMSAMTARIVGLALTRGPMRARLRDAGFVVAERLGLVQRILAPLLGQLDVDYRPGGRPAPWRRRGARPGRRAPLFPEGTPDAPESGTATAPVLARDAYTVVLWPGRRVPRRWAQTSASLRRALGTDDVRTLDAAGFPGADVAALRRAFGPRARLVAIRPDGHVAAIASVRRPEAILDLHRSRPAAPRSARPQSTIHTPTSAPASAAGRGRQDP